VKPLKNNLGKTLFFCFYLFLPDSWDALSTDSLPEAEIIWRIKTQHTPQASMDLLEGVQICCRFFATGNLGD
jgi:hypothetical protein